jgi:hypothetical protein
MCSSVLDRQDAIPCKYRSEPQRASHGSQRMIRRPRRHPDSTLPRPRRAADSFFDRSCRRARTPRGVNCGLSAVTKALPQGGATGRCLWGGTPSTVQLLSTGADSDRACMAAPSPMIPCRSIGLERVGRGSHADSRRTGTRPHGPRWCQQHRRVGSTAAPAQAGGQRRRQTSAGGVISQRRLGIDLLFGAVVVAATAGPFPGRRRPGNSGAKSPAARSRAGRAGPADQRNRPEIAQLAGGCQR